MLPFAKRSMSIAGILNHLKFQVFFFEKPGSKTLPCQRVMFDLQTFQLKVRQVMFLSRPRVNCPGQNAVDTAEKVRPAHIPGPDKKEEKGLDSEAHALQHEEEQLELLKEEELLLQLQIQELNLLKTLAHFPNVCSCEHATDCACQAVVSSCNWALTSDMHTQYDQTSNYSNEAGFPYLPSTPQSIRKKTSPFAFRSEATAATSRY